MDDYAFVYSQGHVYHLLVAAQDLPLVFANEEKNLALFDNSPPNIATIFMSLGSSSNLKVTYHFVQQLRDVMRHWLLQQESMVVQKTTQHLPWMACSTL